MARLILPDVQAPKSVTYGDMLGHVVRYQRAYGRPKLALIVECEPHFVYHVWFGDYYGHPWTVSSKIKKSAVIQEDFDDLGPLEVQFES